MARARRAPKAKPRPRRRAASKRQPKRILNVIESPKQDEDWTFQNAEDADMIAAAPQIPSSKDLRADWWKVNDQKSTGSCVGWATADSVLRWHFVKAGRLSQSTLLSPRFIWMASKETDQFTSRPTTFVEVEGTSLKSALDIARKYGAVRDSALPWATGRLYPGQTNTLYALAAQYKILAYFNLGDSPSDWRAWIASNGPILTRLTVDATWRAVDGTGKLTEYKASTAKGGHAIAIVGYRPGEFIVRNSWGTDWGERGFAYASDSYAENAFTEAYGVSV